MALWRGSLLNFTGLKGGRDWTKIQRRPEKT